ncbi:MAG: NPCBM/NEW2 domain-containing protein [Gemmataceae bacterium]|nr:NPCBM/NEW2 domain-containing protein [Gemmataceae bacterium]
MVAREPTGKTYYLVDLKEVKFSVGWGKEPGKGIHSAKEPNGDKPIMVKGKAYKRALFMHGKPNETVYVTYNISGRCSVFQSSVAIEDSCACESPLIFSVVGDGKVLWKSEPMGPRGVTKDCKVNVTGVKQLELRILTDGGRGNGLCGVWVDPFVK